MEILPFHLYLVGALSVLKESQPIMLRFPICDAGIKYGSSVLKASNLPTIISLQPFTSVCVCYVFSIHSQML